VVIDKTIATRIRQQLPPMSDRTFRDLLRAADTPLAPLVEGIRQDDFHQLERSLLAYAQEYGDAPGDLQKQYRRAVILAKDHARLASRNEKLAAEKRAQKEEMVLWMLTWLENPQVFELWVPLRKAHLTTQNLLEL